MQAVAAEAPELAGAAASRTAAALAQRRPASDIDLAAARAEFAAMMKAPITS
jgi:hypothetical protein